MASGEKPSGTGGGAPSPSGTPTKFGPFWLETRIAVGGTAEVFLARPIDPQAEPRKLVVKRLLPQFLKDPDGRTMFEREAALHAAVRHHNVVQVYGFGTVGDEPWLAMEYIDGCDLFRLLRRLANDGRALSPSVSTYAAREILSALESVHGARDANGNLLGIIHRDVTPSNVYLSVAGRVTLGDFGIARAASVGTKRTAGAMLKGKFAYLSPEQVAGDPFDHRADLFALAGVLTEMILGHPLFAGSGQLAVLLAIRDCRIDTLREARATLPKGMFDVLERALARSPSARTPTASALSRELMPFDTNPNASQNELSALVRWVRSAPSVEQMPATRDSAAKLRARVAKASSAAADAAAETPEGATSDAPGEFGEGDRATGEYGAIPSFVVTTRGLRLGPWKFARLVEAIATGEITREDSIDYMGRGFAKLAAIDDLTRFIPAAAEPRQAESAGQLGQPSEWSERVSPKALVTILARIAESEATGVLVAEGPPESIASGLPGDRQAATGDRYRDPRDGHKELYFVSGKLHHIASNNASELLGEYAVRRGMISREELDFALAVLPRYAGHMGDTLIGLGLLGSLEIFRAIRDQGRDRLVDLFQWRTGKLTFRPGPTAPRVDFPLDLDVPPLLLAGIEASAPGEAPLARWRDRLGDVLAPSASVSPALRKASWPPTVRRLLDIVNGPMPLRDVLSGAACEGATTANDALRAVEVLLGASMLKWQ
jgi:serine/threonine protein kinase